jgi:hypothetical protein
MGFWVRVVSSSITPGALRETEPKCAMGGGGDRNSFGKGGKIYFDGGIFGI